MVGSMACSMVLADIPLGALIYDFRYGELSPYLGQIGYTRTKYRSGPGPLSLLEVPG